MMMMMMMMMLLGGIYRWTTKDDYNLRCSDASVSSTFTLILPTKHKDKKKTSLCSKPRAEQQSSRLVTGTKMKIHHFTFTRGCTWLARCFPYFFHSFSRRSYPYLANLALSAKGNDV
jgi:hypothetical protein